MWVLLLVLVAIVAWPFIVEHRRTKMSRAFQENAPGELIETSLGRTHIRWYGPARGPVVVAVHGLTTPSPVWNAIAMRLGEMGYRTLTYDLYGRGFSDSPKGDQNCAFFLKQLEEVLESQGLDDDLTIIGNSMGGAITAAFAAAYPERMRRVILVVSAGLDMNTSAFSKFCINTPVLGDWLYLAFGERRGLRGIKAEKSLPIEVDGLIETQMAEYRKRGFLQAVLSSRRNMLADQLDAEHRIIGRADIPVVAIWGVDDTVIPLTAMGRLAQLNRAARQEQIQNAGHALAYTHSQDVKSILADVLAE